MKILHFSDTHLGFSEYTKTDPETGLNQREVDFYKAWYQVIDAIQSYQPDVVIHAGDLFHTPRPSNRALCVAFESIQKIGESDIPVVLISGNHETPRIRTTGSIFESLSIFKNVYAAFSSRYENFQIKGINFHCIPHCSLSEELDFALKNLKKERPKANKKNILVSHGAWTGQKYYGMGEFNEQRLPDISNLTEIKFDYVALGHYHRFLNVADKVYYSGSTERTSLNEHNTTCGFIIADVVNETIEYQEITSRPMLKPAPVDCSGLRTSEIYAKLENSVNSTFKNAIMQINLFNIEKDVFLRLDTKQIDEIYTGCFIVEKQLYRKIDNNVKVFTDSRIAALPLEFERYLEKIEHLELGKKRLADLAAKYLDTNQD